MLHVYVVQDVRDEGLARYAFIALVVVAALNIGTCFAVKLGASIRVFEAASGAAVAAACLLTLLARGTFYPRQVLVTALMCAWGARMSLLLYAQDRKKETANVLARVAWGAVCALPAVVCNVTQRQRYRSTPVEVLAVAGALISLALEHVADKQKLAWHRAHAEQRPGRGDAEPPVCASGAWSWSRHPNLFFEITFHWFIYALVRPVEKPLVVACPLLITAMVVALPGGVVAQEIRRNDAYGLYPAYVKYRDATTALAPFPPARRAHEERLRMPPGAADAEEAA